MAVSARTDEQKAVFRDRREAWADTYLGPVAAAIRHWAGKTGRGQPPIARAYLRDVLQHADEITARALGSMVAGVVRQDGLTSLCANVGKAVAKACGKPLADEDQGLQVGYLVVSVICEVTGAASIEDRHGDRPEKVAGGVKLTPSYELRVTGGKFLADAVRFGAVGMPTFSKNGPAPWTDQKTGGADGQEDHGAVHGAGRQMAGVTVETAPALFEALNHAQAARFKVNPVTAAVVTAYDPAKARAWLLARFLAEGMDPAKADAKAREMSRL